MSKFRAYAQATWEIYLELIEANAKPASVFHFLLGGGLVLWLMW